MKQLAKVYPISGLISFSLHIRSFSGRLLASCQHASIQHKYMHAYKARSMKQLANVSDSKSVFDFRTN